MGGWTRRTHSPGQGRRPAASGRAKPRKKLSITPIKHGVPANRGGYEREKLAAVYRRKVAPARKSGDDARERAAYRDYYDAMRKGNVSAEVRRAAARKKRAATQANAARRRKAKARRSKR